MPCAVILTSTSTDFQAVRSHLTDVTEHTIPQGTIYNIGQFSSGRQAWDVVVVDVASENSSAAIETERAINEKQPSVVLSIGVATGLRYVSEGDVVAGIEVYNYESGKVTNAGFLPRPKIGLSSYTLTQRATAEARKDSWLERVPVNALGWAPKVLVGAIAAGEKEITCTQSEVGQILKSTYGEALALDNTGYGILKAIHANAGISALIIRGITQLVGQDAIVSQEKAETMAAQHASAFAFEILAKLDPGSSSWISTAKYEKLQQDLVETSKELLRWKCTLSNDKQIERSEKTTLISRITAEESSTTVLLGAPGSGKSSLMASLGADLVAQGCAVLAIKADHLSGAINNREDLQKDLKLEFDAEDAAYMTASKEKIVILIDQLDAVAELSDKNSQRLHLLLSLIQRLSGVKNIHIVATCREFEFHYSTQFSRLSDADSLMLSLPAWDDVSLILKESGYKPTSMGDSLQQLLQSPLHLNTFLEVAKPEDVFTSSQMLLDRLWEIRVKKQKNAEKRIEFIEMLAHKMSDQEVLWLPEAVTDISPAIAYELEQAGLLVRNPGRGTIGFRHQTYYDHALARAFARGSQSLNEFVVERQGGLFVRPILLRGLDYLRGTASQQYQQQLISLLRPSQQYIRTHIRILLIEFLGSQQNPDSVEASLLIPLLSAEREGIKILSTMVGSPGWFKHLRDRPEFIQWLENPTEHIYCRPLLMAAEKFAPEEVWSLLEEHWLPHTAYDHSIIRVLWDMEEWTLQMIDQIVQVIKRSKIEWHDVRSIAESSTEDFPHSGSKFIRAHLDQLADDAIELGQKNASALYADTNDIECCVYTYKNERQKPLVDLLDSHDFYELEVFAKNNPKAFLDEIWPWFMNMMAHHIYEDDYSQSSSVYRGKFCFHVGAYPGKLIEAFIVSIVKLAQHNRADFLLFLNENSQSDHLIIHKLFFYGLEKIADKEPKTVLDYLLGDSRRLCLGSGTSEHHSKTKKLIAAICPHLSSKSRQQLEDAILNVNYSQLWEGCGAENRAAVLRWNRQHRLQLLLAFPEECLSRRAKQLRQEESRAFPWEIRRNERPSVGIAQVVGARMTKEEMSHAKDEHIISLFNEISDATDPNYFREDLSRSGGVIQQSREFGDLVKESPARFFKILPSMKPQKHESYVGEAIKVLSETTFSAAALIELIESLYLKGFSSEEFSSTVAGAFENLAEKNSGLPQSSLSILESWLATHSKPELGWYKNEAHRHSIPLHPIVFGTTGSHNLASGRGAIVRAIAAGYLNQTPPNLQGWERFVEEQLDVEKHPVVWVDILWRMPVLLNLDRAKATCLFDSIIQNFPEVLSSIVRTEKREQ